MENPAAATDRSTDPTPPEPGEWRAAPLADIASLTVGAVVGALLTMIPLGYLILPPIQLPEPFADHHQTAETLLFLVAFAVVVPATVIFVPRLADRIASYSATALAGLSAVACATLIALLLAVKVSAWLPWGDGLPILLVAMAIWWVAVGAVSLKAAHGMAPEALDKASEKRDTIWLAAAALLVISTLAFAFADSISPSALVLTSLLAGARRLAWIWMPWLAAWFKDGLDC